MLYVRHQKAEQAQITQESPLQEETFHVQHTTGQHMTDACSKAKQAVQNAMQKSQEWMKEQNCTSTRKAIKELTNTVYESNETECIYICTRFTSLKTYPTTKCTSSYTISTSKKYTENACVFDKTVVHTLFINKICV